MAEPTLEAVESKLDRATDLPETEAIPVLEAAREDVRLLADEPSVNEDRRSELEDRVAQRIRQIEQRDAYDGALGSSMNPDQEDAP